MAIQFFLYFSLYIIEIMKYLYYILLFSVVNIENVEARRKKNTPQMLEDQTHGGQPGNPGFEIIITEKGMNYVNSIAGELLNEMLTKVKVPNIRHNVNNGFVEATNLHITKFIPPTYGYQLIPESTVKWGLQNAGVFVNGQWKAEKKVLITFGASGEFEATASDFSISISITFSKTHEGKSAIINPECHTGIGELKLKISGGVIGWVINWFKSLIAKSLKPTLETEICKQAMEFIKNDFNSKLQTSPVMVPINNVLSLDTSLIKQPSTANNTYETKHNGQISVMGMGGTPFYPHQMKSDKSENKMINLFVSDYIMNSFFYHAHANNMVEFVLENETFLNLRCPGEFCLGDMIPRIASNYPGSTKATIHVKSLEPPTTHFSPEKATLQSKGIIQIVLDNPNGQKKEVVVNALLELTAELNIWFKGMNITGDADIAHFELSLINSTIPMTDEPLRALSDLIQPLLRVLANNELRKGIPLKFTKGVTLVNPAIQFAERTLQIYSDVKYSSTERSVIS